MVGSNMPWPSAASMLDGSVGSIEDASCSIAEKSTEIARA